MSPTSPRPFTDEFADYNTLLAALQQHIEALTKELQVLREFRRDNIDKWHLFEAKNKWMARAIAAEQQQERDRAVEQLAGDVRAMSQDYSDAKAALSALREALRAKLDKLKSLEDEMRADFRKNCRTDAVRANTSNSVADGYASARRLFSTLLDAPEGRTPTSARTTTKE